MKIAVTSASGQLGSAIVKQLIEEIGSENVVGIARTPEKAIHLGVEIRKGDYNDRNELNTALKGVNSVLLVSGMDKPQNRIPQHRNVIESAKSNGVNKIVYTSIIGDEKKNAFSPIVQSNRQTESDIRNSGLDWVVGRNGIYIEPDLEYIDNYLKRGEISNCAGDGKCAYTSRKELACAYANMLINEKHNGNIYNLVGEAITQKKLTEYINEVYKINLTYRYLSVDDYVADRKKELGEFLGTIIAGIYEGIHDGVYDTNSDFIKAVGRPHKLVLEIIKEFKTN